MVKIDLSDGTEPKLTTNSEKLAKDLVATLPIDKPGLFNPWREPCKFDTPRNGPEERFQRLTKHLDCDASLILVGEAPGYAGARYSGVAFTSERLLMEGAIPRIEAIPHRLSVRKLPFSEPSATIVWKTLYRLGVAEQTILWNAVQLHPFKGSYSWSNRTPTDTELTYGVGALKLLQKAYPRAMMVAVGKKAAGVLSMLEIPFCAAVRHPANGGATLFSEGLATALK